LLTNNSDNDLFGGRKIGVTLTYTTSATATEKSFNACQTGAAALWQEREL
jgi:hypothetical protein